MEISSNYPLTSLSQAPPKNRTQFAHTMMRTVGKIDSVIIPLLVVLSIALVAWIAYSASCSCGKQRAYSKPGREKASALSIDDSIRELFASNVKAKKLFTIDGQRVGIIFNPGGNAISEGSIRCLDPVAIISETALPAKVLQRIRDLKPEGLTHSEFAIKTHNGRPVFEALNFK